MDAEAVGAALREAMGGRVEPSVRSPRRLYASLEARDLPEAARWLLARLPGCRLATCTGIDLRDGVGLFHHFAVNGSPLVITLKVLLPKPDPRAPSLVPLTAAADWIEREIRDLLGVTFEGHPREGRFLKPEELAGSFPLRRGFDPAASRERTDG